MKYIDLIIAPFVKKGLIWIQETASRIVGSIILLIVVLAFGIMFSKWLTFGGLFRLTSKLFNIGVLFSSKYYIFLLWMITVFVLGIICYLWVKERETRIIKVKFKRNSKPEDYFTIPNNSDWSFIQDDDVLGNVLSVTNSMLTGHLIKGAEWHNYCVSFKTKIISSNFTFAIRTIDKNNGVFFQCGDKNICPHLLTNGIFIRHFNDVPLPIEIPKNKWISVFALVEGDRVTININGMNREFSIPKGPWFIEKENLKAVLEYSDVKKATSEALHSIGIIAEIKVDQAIDEVVKGLSEDIINKIKLNKYFAFNFDLDRGTIGFREDGSEQALFKDIKIELKDKI